MAGKHLEKCSMSLVIWKMEIKMPMRFHLTKIKMAKINNSNMLVRMWSKGNIPLLLVRVQTCTTTLEINLVVSLKTENGFISRPMPLLATYTKDDLLYTTGKLAQLCLQYLYS